MKKFNLFFFAVIIILLQFVKGAAALGTMAKLPDGNTEKLVSTPLIGEGVALPLPVKPPKNSIRLKYNDYNSLKDVKINNGKKNDQVTFSHFYQNVLDSAGTAWNVSTIDILMFTKYISLGLIIERGDLSDPSGKLWTKNMVHRFGVEIGQSYSNNDSAFFGVRFAKEKFFPELLFKLGYGGEITPSIDACVEIQGIFFEEQKAYTAVSLAITKKYSTHEFTVKPYWSASKYSKLNLALIEKIDIQQGLGTLTFQGVTGYFPDNNIFIDYNNVTKQRFRLSGEALVKVSGTRTMLHPACGTDYFKGEGGRFRSNWFVKLGLVVYL